MNILEKSAEEFVCDKCNGKGVTIVETIELYESCKKCNGEKTFTWIDNIIGKIANIITIVTFMITYKNYNIIFKIIVD